MSGGDYTGPSQEYIDAITAAPADQGGGGAPADQGGGGGGGGGPADLNAIYQQYLGRGVDTSGAGTFAGMDAGSVIAAIQASPEYAARATAGAPVGGGTDLSSIYQQYLGRNVDPSGASTFAGQSADSVINAILNSPEYASRAGVMGAAGTLPPGAATALASMDVAPSWLPPTQYAQYGFNAQGKRENKEGLATFLQSKTPEGVPGAPIGFTYAGSNKINPSDDSYGTLTHSYNDEKGGTLTIDQYGNTQYTPGNQFYAEQLAKHPDAIATGYRNQQYLSRGGIDSTINVPGIGPVELNQAFTAENLYNPNTKQLYKDPSGNYVQVYRPDSGGGFDNIIEKAVEMGIITVGAIGGGIAGGPAGAAAGSGLVSLKNETPLNQAIRNAAMSAGTAYIGGQLSAPGGIEQAGPTYGEMGYTGLAEGAMGPTYGEMGYTGLNQSAAIAAADAASADAIANGFGPSAPSAEESIVNAATNTPTFTPVEPDITQVLQQTYPDANISAPVAQAPLTAAEIQAANLPMDVALQPGTVSAATNNIGYLPPNASSDVLINTAEENLKRGATNWWQVTGNKVVDAGIKNAVFGSGMGALTSAITGGSAGKGALYGGIAGGITGAGAQYIFPNGAQFADNKILNAGLTNAGAGALNSAIATALAKGDVGRAAILGGLISGTAGAGLEAYSQYSGNNPQVYARGSAEPYLDRFTPNADILENQNQLLKAQATDVGTPKLSTDYGIKNVVQTGANPYSGVGINPAIENLYGGIGLNPNVPYITSGLANNAEALAQASGVPIDRATFDARGGLTPEQAAALDKALTDAESAGIPFEDAIKSIIPFLGFAVNPPGKNQAPSGGGGGGSAPPKKAVKVPKRAGGGKNWDNYLLHHIVNAGNVYTPEATGYQSVGYKEGGMIDGIQHYDVGGSISSGLTNLFKPVEQNVIQPVGQAAPWLKTVLPYAAMAAAPFMPSAGMAAGLGALGSGFGTTPGAGFNMKRALMGGIASYGMSNIGSGLAEAGQIGATAPTGPSFQADIDVLDSIGGKAPIQNPATTGGFWDQVTNKAENMKQGVGNLMKGGDSFTTAANAYGTKAGMGSAGMAIMGGSGVLGVDEADAQNQAVAGTNSSAAQQQAIQAEKRAQAKINAQNAVAAHPFHFAMGGMMPNPPDDQTGMPSRSPLTRLEQGGSVGYAMGGMANVPRFLSGGGDGMSDSIHANIDGSQEARLADGEFVIPADVVSHLGNGSSKAGAKQLYSMMDRVRQARTGKKSQGREINPNKLMPV